jgi:hypothetical protein
MIDEYLHFDEIEDVLSSVDLLALVIPLADEQPNYWKWIIITAHAALQGAMVCALGATSSLPVLEKRSAQEMRIYLETGEGQPEQRLANFDTLLKRCRNGKFMSNEPLQLDAAQANDISRLHDHFRNEFIHFTPKGWCIEKAGLPRMVRAAVDVVEKLMSHSRVLYKLDDGQRERLAARLKSVQSNLKS